jgi:VanZ family protein
MTVPLWLARLLFAVAAIAIAVLSLLPTSALPDIALWDKLQHLIAYAGLTATATFAAPAGVRRGWSGHLLLASAMIAFGGAIELLQGLVPGRFPAFADLIANGLGVLAGVVSARVLMARDVLKPAD